MSAQDPQPQVTVHHHGGATVIVPVGDFDLANLSGLREALLDADPATRPVVLDMENTTFVDSTVLGVLTAAARTAQDAGGRLRVARPRHNIRRILALMALDTIIDVHPSVEAALECASGADPELA